MEIIVEDKDPEKTYIQVPIVKASIKEEPAFAEICYDDVPEDVLRAIFIAGAKVYLNRGMNKLTGSKTVELRTEAMEIAAQNLENIYSGRVRMPAGVRSKISGAIRTEAMRIARLVIKNAIKSNGEKVGDYTAKDISELAKELIEGEQGKEILADAKLNLEERAKKDQKLKGSIDLSKLKPSPELQRKNAERNAKNRKPGKAPVQAVRQGHRVGA